MNKLRVLLFLTLLCFIPLTINAAVYYASPTGGGNGSAITSPFQIANFWSVAKPGDVLLLLDGKYTGASSMIAPPQGLSGASGQPITVRAVNDGQVEIDGQFVRRPVYLFYNDYFVLEGFNAHSSDNAVVELSRSNHNIVRRVCAWDAGDVNTGNCFAAHHGSHNLFEDCAGWGTARKVFTNSQGGDYTTFRRCWGRWEVSTKIGPKMTYTFCYNSYNTVVENCIGTWNEKMSSVNQPYGIFSMDRNDGDNNANSRLLGCIAYLKNNQEFAPNQLYFVSKLNSVEIKDCLGYVEPGGSHSGIKSFALYSNNDGTPPNLTAKNLTSIGIAAPYIHSDWQQGNIYHTNDGSELIAKKGHILQADGGANLMTRYENGVLTSNPLWPWPMNQRIIDAMTVSGRQPVDVTKTIFELAGGTMPNFNNDDLSITDIRLTKADQSEPLDYITREAWHDLYLYFNREQTNWSDIAFADIWISSPEFTVGNISNRGGEFHAADNYVMSFSISNPGIWVRQNDESLEWQSMTGKTGLYVDDSNFEYEVNPAEGWAKVRFKILGGATVGSWSINAYVKGTDGAISTVATEPLEVLARKSPFLRIAASYPSEPVNGGSVTVSVTTATNVQSLPGHLLFTDSEDSNTVIPLTGSVPGNTFAGVLSIDEVKADGIGQFSFIDLEGNIIEDISGKFLRIDRTAPSFPPSVSGVFSE